jgi:hypothetical protein
MKQNYIYTLSQNNIIFYIGKTNNIQKRVANHKITYGKNILLEILEETNNWKQDEKYWIEQFKCWGFNLNNKNNGGGGVEIVTDFTKNLISKNQPKTKPPCSEERKIKIGLSQPKQKTPCSEERKQRISEKNKGKKKNLGKKYNTIIFKKVIQYDLKENIIKEWGSVKEILEYLNKNSNNMNIYKCLRGELNTAYKFKWKYKITENE